MLALIESFMFSMTLWERITVKKKKDIKVKNCTKGIHRFLFVDFIFEQPCLCD